MLRTRRLSVVAMGACLALALGVELSAAQDRASQTPRQILREVRADLGAVRSYRVAGVARDAEGTTRLRADVTSSGSVAMRASIGNRTFALRKPGRRTYMRANAAFWRAAGGSSRPEVARALADRWIRLPADLAREFEPVYRRLTPRRLAACTFSSVGTVVRDGVGTVGGRRAVVLRDRGDRPGTSPGRVWITAAGPALPLRAVQTGRERPGGRRDPACDLDGERDTTTRADLRFSRFNRVGRITAPRPAVDLADVTPSETTPSAAARR